jgi:hypothetical protein
MRASATAALDLIPYAATKDVRAASRPRGRRAAEQRDEVAPSHVDLPPRCRRRSYQQAGGHRGSSFAALPACQGQGQPVLGPGLKCSESGGRRIGLPGEGSNFFTPSPTYCCQLEATGNGSMQQSWRSSFVKSEKFGATANVPLLLEMRHLTL